MAKFEEPFEDVQELFDEKIVAASLDQYVNIVVVVNNTAKDVYKVVKANDLSKHLTSYDIVIILNQNIFEQLTDVQKHIIVEESLASIHFDNEKDKLIITKPDVVAFSGILSKYTFDTWIVLHETIKSLYTAEKNSQ
jgi:hypothetical protein